MPMAMMALTMPGPNTAVSMMADRMAGNAKPKSATRMMTSSTQPRRADASRPNAVPMTRPMPTAITPTTMDARAPTSSSDTMSRPKASVPSQCVPPGRQQPRGHVDVVGRMRRPQPATARRPDDQQQRQHRAEHEAAVAQGAAPEARAQPRRARPAMGTRTHMSLAFTRGSIAAYSRSTTKLTMTTMAASSITQLRTTIRSRLEIDWKIRRPRPGR